MNFTTHYVPLTANGDVYILISPSAIVMDGKNMMNSVLKNISS